MNSKGKKPEEALKGNILAILKKLKIKQLLTPDVQTLIYKMSG